MAIDYRSYIRSKAWRGRRIQVITRSGGICERCGKYPVAQVHHKTYERLGFEAPSDLEGLCVKCHFRHHQGQAS